jgi:hypothetical protein
MEAAKRIKIILISVPYCLNDHSVNQLLNNRRWRSIPYPLFPSINSLGDLYA